MKKSASRDLVLLLLTGVLLLGAAFPAVSVQVAPGLPGRTETVVDRVGNDRLHNARAPLTRNGMRILGASVPLSGTVNLLAIPVQFTTDTDPNTSGTGTFPYKTWGPAADPNYLQSRLQAMCDYYADTSKGKITLQYTLTTVVSLKNAMSKYAADYQTGNPNTIMTDVVAAADGQINFASADIIMLIHAGCGQEITGLSGDIWSHHMTGVSIPTNDGVTISGYSVMPETECGDLYFKLANQNIDILQYEKDPSKFNNVFIPHYWDVMGTWAHETGHAFGMPDVYDTTYSTGVSLQSWSLMGSGNYLPEPPANAQPWRIPYDPTQPLFGSVPCHPDAWNLKLLGWAPVDNITGARTRERVVAMGTQEGKIYRLWTNGDISSDEYFLMETRSHVGYDRFVPEEGLLIYHIDDTIGSLTLNNLQSDAKHPRILPVPSSGQLTLDPNFGDYFAGTGVAYPGASQNVHFGNNTLPNNHSYKDVPTFVDASNITRLAQDCLVDFRTYHIQINVPYARETLYVKRPTVSAYAPNLNSDSIVIDINGTTYPVTSYDPITGELSAKIGPLDPGNYTMTISGMDLNQTDSLSESVDFTIKQKTLAAGKQMVSLPVVGVGTVQDVFQQPSPLLYWWNPATQMYARYPEFPLELTENAWAAVDQTSGAIAAPAGKAFWMNLPTAVALNLDGDSSQDKHRYELSVYKGNDHSGDFIMIGNPYNYPVDFAAMQVDFGGRIYTMAEAINQHLLDPVLYWWTGSGYTVSVFPNGTLQPWQGYWLYIRAGAVNLPLKLIFQPVPAQTRASAQAARQPASSTGWETTLKASSATSTQQAALTLGVLPEATDAIDAGKDLYAPPSAPEGISLTAQETRGAAMMRDYKAPASSAKYQWDVQVQGPAGGQVVLTWPDLTRLPKDEVITLRDTVTGDERYLRTSASYTVALGPQESVRQLEVTVSPRGIGGLQILNLQAIRTRANGAVNIACQVSTPALTTVEIRSMNGRLVRRLPATRAQGAVSMTWDGKNTTGQLVPHGAYQCQVHAVTNTGESANAITLLPL